MKGSRVSKENQVGLEFFSGKEERDTVVETIAAISCSGETEKGKR